MGPDELGWVADVKEESKISDDEFRKGCADIYLAAYKTAAKRGMSDHDVAQALLIVGVIIAKGLGSRSLELMGFVSRTWDRC